MTTSLSRSDAARALRIVADAVVEAVASAGACGIGEGPLLVALSESNGMRWDDARALVNVLVDVGKLERDSSYCLRVPKGSQASASAAVRG
jgi:hypothetical protein